MSEPVIAVNNVSKRFRVPLDHSTTLQYRFSHPISSSRYRELLAVNDVSFEIEKGDFVGIAGPNGSGKSTLLRMISRIDQPDTGSVVVRGRVAPFIDLGVGFKPELTARENVFLAGAVLGLTREQIATRVDDVFEFAELVEFADQKIKRFSSGMGARLAFSCAMLGDADILLLDEVLAVGDVRFREKCLSVFAHYKRTNRTVVLVSHDLSTMEMYCDRVLLMLGGQLVADGVPADVTAEYRRVVSKMSEPRKAVRPELTPSLEGAPNARRWGTREVEITAVRLVDADGRPHHSFLTGEPLAVEIDYVSNSLRGGFACSVGFGRNNIALLSAPHTKWVPRALPAVMPGSRGTIVYRMPAVSFLSASYSLSVSISDEKLNHMYDAVQNVMEFRVTDDRGRPGWIDIGGEWTHRDASDRVDDQGAVA